MSKDSKTPTIFSGFISRFVLLLVSLSVVGIATAQPNQSALPRQLAWTAYNLGTTGYNQAVGIGAMLREKYGVTLRLSLIHI